MEINSRAATDKLCKKRKEGYIEPRKKDKTIDGFGEDQGRFSDSRRTSRKKGAPGVFGADKLMISNSQHKEKGGKNAHEERKK